MNYRKWKEVFRKNYHQLIFVFIAFLLMIVVSIVSMNAITRQKLLNASDEALQTVEANIKMNLQEPEATLVSAVFTVQYMIANQASQDEILQYLTGLTDWLLENEERVSGFNGIYGVIRGDYLDGMGWEPPADYIPEERPWYIAAKESVDDIDLTAPYIDAQTQVGIISFSKRLQNLDGEPIGVISLDIMLTRLTEYVSSLQQSYGGYGILLDSDFNIVAHPLKEFAGISLEALSGDYAGIADELKAGVDVTGKTIRDTDGRSMILFFRRLYNGWYVGMLTPVDSYYSDMYRMEAILIAMGSVLMLALSLILMRLAAAKMRSDEENQSKSSFLAHMSHEIRTPMNAIMGMSELILREELPQSVYENAQGIRNASGNLLSIINNILDFSKIESGMLEIVETEYLFPSLINDVISVIRMRLLEKPVQFAVCIDNTIPVSLIGDEVRVRQIFLNILSNAVKYTEKGFVSLSVSCEMNDGVAMLEITVADTGIGIKKEDMSKLFGNFSRLDATKNKDVEGTGLGLAITRNLCCAMGGDIAARSDYGTGSEFIVTLPQRYALYKPCAVVENPDEKSVLLYETREAYRDSVVCTLNMLGVRCENVESIAKMFEHVSEYPYLLVSSFMYESIKPALAKYENPPQLILIADVKETIAPMDAEVLAMPAHAISIANILNGVREKHGRVTVTGVSFTTPEARLLIVDDISANLKVAEGLMSPYEMGIDLAASGKDAVRMIQENTYDLVFMDHMMPEMDGLEATAIIRALEDEYYQTLPIIALTANAVSGIREMFIQNGMNDFLAKPIEMTKLNAILEKWIPKSKRWKVKLTDSGTAYDLSETEDFMGEVRKLKWLSADKASAALGGFAAYERTFRLSVKLLPENIDKLEACIDIELARYAVEVHGIKGVLNGIGAYSLGEEALELEILAKANDAGACGDKHSSFISEVKAFLEAAAPLLGEGEKQHGEPERLLEAIPAVEQALEAYDGLLALELISPLAKYTYGLSADALLTELVSAFEHFDFDKATEDLRKLKTCLGGTADGKI